jgi:hypothetical protein
MILHRRLTELGASIIDRTNYDTLNARTVRAAAMVNVAGTVVSPEVSTFVSAMNDFAGQADARILLLGKRSRSQAPP